MPHPRHRELTRLVDETATAAVLSIVTLDEIAAVWCDYHAVEHDDGDLDDDDLEHPDWWAVQFFFTCIEADLRAAALLALVACAQDSHRVLGAIGAGPFEDFIDAFDPAQVEWIEHHAAHSPAFQEALRNMFLSRSLGDDHRLRINRAAGFAPDRWLKFCP